MAPLTSPRLLLLQEAVGAQERRPDVGHGAGPLASHGSDAALEGPLEGRARSGGRGGGGGGRRDGPAAAATEVVILLGTDAQPQHIHREAPLVRALWLACAHAGLEGGGEGTGVDRIRRGEGEQQEEGVSGRIKVKGRKNCRTGDGKPE